MFKEIRLIRFVTVTDYIREFNSSNGAVQILIELSSLKVILEFPGFTNKI